MVQERQEPVPTGCPGRHGTGDLRARREFEVLCRVAGEGVPEALELLETRPNATLVLEHPSGVPLESWIESARPEPGAVLEVMLQLTRVVARTHAVQLLHGELHASHVYVDADRPSAQIVNFGSAHPLGSRRQAAIDRAIHESGAQWLQFIAPEQAGRMDRSVDFRSDLYSLGVLMYLMSCGCTPFEDTDALALIHAHMARVPLAPRERNPEIPNALSQISMKLLQKEPEDRYQSALSLEHDLVRCRDELSRTGTIDPELELGSLDVAARPRFAKRLYGRTCEARELHRALARSVTDSPQWIVLSGPAGIGKSSVVASLGPEIAQAHGRLLRGKFDRFHREKPYSGVQQALTSLAQQLLMERDEVLSAARASLQSGLGDLCGVLVAFVPDFAHILGQVAWPHPLGPRETRARLALTVQRTLAYLGTPEHPLVLHLDDLQSADQGSQYILVELVRELRAPGILMILTCCNEDAASADASPILPEIAAAATHVCIRGLDVTACSEMLQSALARSPDDTLELAECVLRKTGGSPLLVEHFVQHLCDLGQIHRKNEGWVWSLDAIREASVPDDAVSLLLPKLSSLETATRELLQIAACVGDPFEAKQLRELSESSDQGIEASLVALTQDGLLVTTNQGFRFAHERIREATLSLLGERRLSELHAHMAWRLLERTPTESLASRVLEIADYLTASDESVPEERRAKTLEVLRLAAERSLGAGAGATAMKYLKKTRALYFEREGAENGDDAYALLITSAEACHQADALHEALEHLERAQGYASDLLRRARVVSRRIAIQTLLREQDPVSIALEFLGALGYRLPRRPSRLRVGLDLWRTDRDLRGPLDRRAFSPPERPPPHRVIAALLVLRATGPALMLEGVRGVCAELACATRLMHRHGSLLNPGYLLAAYAAFRAALRRDLEGLERYTRAVCEWIDKDEDAATRVRARFLLHAYLLAWLRPKREQLEPLAQVWEQARTIGEVEYGHFAIEYISAYSAWSGEPLSRVIEHLRHVTGLRTGTGASAGELAMAVYRLLHERAPVRDLDAEIDALDRDIARTHGSGDTYWPRHVHWLLGLVVLGRAERAFAVAERIQPYADGVSTPGATLADYVFLRGLAAASLGRSGAEGRRRVRIVRACARQLRVWAKHSPDCVPMSKLVLAELARLRRRVQPALSLYLRRSACLLAWCTLRFSHALTTEPRHPATAAPDRPAPASRGLLHARGASDPASAAPRAPRAQRPLPPRPRRLRGPGGLVSGTDRSRRSTLLRPLFRSRDR